MLDLVVELPPLLLQVEPRRPVVLPPQRMLLRKRRRKRVSLPPYVSIGLFKRKY